MLEAEDETAITEITIQPDGRIYVFGLSLEVAQVLSGLCPAGTSDRPTGRQVRTAKRSGKTHPADRRATR